MTTTTPARILAIGAARMGRTVDDVAAELGTVPEVQRVPSVAARAVRSAHNARVRDGAELAEDAPAPAKRKRPAGPIREAFRARSVERGCPNFAPLDWGPEAYRTARAAPRSGGSAFRHWRKLPGEYRQRVQLCALAMEPDELGRLEPTRGWEHPAARFIVALACVFWQEAASTTRRGYARLVQGRSRGMIAGLFVNPQTGAPYSVSRFFADWSHDPLDFWDCGHVVALRRARVVHSVQPPPEVSDPAYVGVDKAGQPRALSQHWISARAASPTAAPMPDAAGFVRFVRGVDVEHVDEPP